jgi:hypothetical protein
MSVGETEGRLGRLRWRGENNIKVVLQKWRGSYLIKHGDNLP